MAQLAIQARDAAAAARRKQEAVAAEAEAAAAVQRKVADELAAVEARAVDPASSAAQAAAAALNASPTGRCSDPSTLFSSRHYHGSQRRQQRCAIPVSASPLESASATLLKYLAVI